jgi:hypothetical protein
MISDGIAPSISVSGIDESLLFLRRQKSDLDRVSLSPLHVLFRKTRPRCCDLELVIEIDIAHHRIVGVDGGEQTTIEKCTERVVLVTRDGARLNVARKARFDPDAPFRQEVEKGIIFDGAGGVTDPLGPELSKSLPHALGAARFTGMYGDGPPGLASAAEVIDRAKKVLLVV